MNRKSLIAAAALAAAGASAFAIEGEQFVPDTSTYQHESSSALSRDVSPTTDRAQPSTLTREQVKSELRELQAAGAWQPVQEASPTPLQAAEADRKIASLSSQQPVAQLSPSEQTSQFSGQADQIALVDDGDGSVIIIESAPMESSAVPESSTVPESSSLPFDHPAVTDTPQR